MIVTGSIDTTEVVKTSILPYPWSIGSIAFSKEELGGRFARGRSDLRDRVKTQMEDLARQAYDLNRYYRDSERIYSAEIRFTPVVGHTYYLYQSGGREWVSMIAPTEWGRPGYVGSYRYDGEGWEKVV